MNLDPEVKAQVLEFVWERQWVTHARIVRELFPDDPDPAGLYLNQLKSDGEICDATNGSGQVSWYPTAEATAGPVIPVRWAQYADGNTHTFTEDEIREKYGISIPQFRRRLIFASGSYSDVSSRVESGAISFRIEGAKNVSAGNPRKRKRPISHVYCGHPITRTDRLACEKRR